jgi:dTDP-4-amino-4,6-dideoxygalactose transaminase
MKIKYRAYRILYKMLYFFHPIELLKKIIKIAIVSKEIFLNKITYYPKSVLDFETNFAKYIGCDYGLTFCNGTSSIESAMFALGIKKGDEVIVPSNTFHASIDPIINLDATPVFIDVEKDCLTISKEQIINKITPKTKCIVIVHIFGYIADIKQIAQIARDNNIALLEDCSHAHGGMFENKKVGSFGDIGCFSLQGAKAIAAGEGGIAVTDNKKLFTKMSMYGHFARHKNLFNTDDDKYRFTGIGHKQRAHPLGIILANIDLKFNDFHNNKMLKNENFIKNIIKEIDCIELFEPISSTTSGGFFGGLPILVNKETDVNKVKNIFSSYGIQMSHYPFELNHKLDIYNQDENNTLINTEYLKENLILIDRRLLIYLSIVSKLILRQIVLELNKEK